MASYRDSCWQTDGVRGLAISSSDRIEPRLRHCCRPTPSKQSQSVDNVPLNRVSNGHFTQRETYKYVMNPRTRSNWCGEHQARRRGSVTPLWVLIPGIPVVLNAAATETSIVRPKLLSVWRGDGSGARTRDGHLE